MKTIHLLFVLLVVTGIQSCAENNFQRQKYTNFGKAKGIHLIPDSDRPVAQGNDRKELIQEEVTDEVEATQVKEAPGSDQISGSELPIEATLSQKKTNLESSAVYNEADDSLSEHPIDMIDLDEMHRSFNAVSIGGCVATLLTAGSTALILIAVESISSLLVVLIPVAFAIVAIVLSAMAVKRGRNLNQIHRAIDYTPHWTFYLLYSLDILFLFANSFGLLFIALLFLIVLAILMGGGW